MISTNGVFEQIRASQAGITRAMDELGRFVIPKHYRSTLGIVPHHPLTIARSGDFLIVWKDQRVQRCHCCGTEANLRQTIGGEVILCDDCLESMMEARK